MFRDREGGDCKGNSYNPAYQGLVTRVWGKHALTSIQNPPVNFFFFSFKSESSRYKALFTVHESAKHRAVHTTRLTADRSLWMFMRQRLVGDGSVHTKRFSPSGGVADLTASHFQQVINPVFRVFSITFELFFSRPVVVERVLCPLKSQNLSLVHPYFASMSALIGCSFFYVTMTRLVWYTVFERVTPCGVSAR